MRTLAPSPEELALIRKTHGMVHERRFEFTPPSATKRAFDAKSFKGIRAKVIMVPVDIYRQAILVRKVGEEDWFFPRGRVYEGEAIDEAAARELREEVGLEPEGGSLKALWWWTANYADGPATIAHFLFLHSVVGEAQARDKREIAEARAFRELPTEGLYKGLIHDALADSGMIHQWEVDFGEEQKFGTG